MLPSVEWRIYYGDDVPFDSQMGMPWDAPCLNVQAIIYRDDDPHGAGRKVLHAFHYYWYDTGEWHGGDLFGLFDYLARPGIKVVKFGRSVSDNAYKTALKRATDDPDFLRRASPP